MSKLSPVERLIAISQQLNPQSRAMENPEAAQASTTRRLEVIIVGGSSAGLMCGIVLKRLGHNVHILEQYPSSKREGLAAGVGFFEHAQEFLKNHDLLFHQPISILAAKAQQLNPDLTVKRVLSLPMHMSSWDVMYYRLRANFDGMASNFCPGPPPSVVGDGQAVFDVGKRVTNIQYVEGRPLVEFVEVADGKKSKSMEADLVIAADGSSSRVREILQPDLQREYPGYVAWRGTVPMRDLPNELMDTIELKTTFYMMHRDYMIIYIYDYTIPGENGCIEHGERLMNLVWYSHVTDSRLAEIMTDTSGHRHNFTLPIGKMRPEIWADQCAHARKVLPSQLADLVFKIALLFVSTVTSIASPRASFFDGKLLLVGDALSQFRPHVGSSTNQAALDALLLEKLLKSEIGLNQWEEQVMEYADLTRLRSISFGSFYMSGYPTLIANVARYLWVFGTQKLWRVWYGSAYPYSNSKFNLL